MPHAFNEIGLLLIKKNVKMDEWPLSRKRCESIVHEGLVMGYRDQLMHH
jgi:hypothetical protein